MRGFDRETFAGQLFGKDGHLEVVEVSPYRKYYPHVDCTVHCAVCAKDPELFGDANFSIIRSSLLKGRVPCGCATNHWWTKEQYKVKILRKCAERNLDFIRCDDEVWRGNSRVDVMCRSHGHTWDMSINKLLQGRGCPRCRKSRGFKKEKHGYIYVLRAEGSSYFTGYGITGQLDKRIAAHRRHLLREGIEFNDWFHGSADGITIHSIEAYLKKTFPMVPQDVEGFRTEATHAHLYDDVVAFVQQRLQDLAQESQDDTLPPVWELLPPPPQNAYLR